MTTYTILEQELDDSGRRIHGEFWEHRTYKLLHAARAELVRLTDMGRLEVHIRYNLDS